MKSHNEKKQIQKIHSKFSEITWWKRGHKFNEFTQNLVKSHNEKEDTNSVNSLKI
jgi:hypothetical protein